MGRRGLLAAAAGLAAATTAKLLTPSRAEATDGQPLVVGVTNTASGATVLLSGNGALAGLQVSAPNGQALRGTTGGQGAIGVLGESTLFDAVRGQGNQGNGVAGLSSAGFGVLGQSTGGAGIGGLSTNNSAIFGTSSNNNGLLGQSGATGGGAAGVFGSGANIGVRARLDAGTAGGTALFAESQQGGATLAARLDGNVQINGNLVVAGTKSRGVRPRSNQSVLRQMYAVESPENWFEDFGESRLVNGRAVVSVPIDFADYVDLQRGYHVFLQAHAADIEALAVTSRTPTSFVVEANGKGQVEGSFSYRIVARAYDVTGRLLTVSDSATRDMPAPPPIPQMLKLEPVPTTNHP